MAYIYKIQNNINNKVYIGKTEKINPEERWKEHQRESKKERNNHRALYRAMQKYGIENFTFSILEETDNPEQREQDYIIDYNSYHYGYNETLGGDGAVYLELPEDEICNFYLTQKNLIKTAEHFGNDIKTIKKVLYKNNISINSPGETTKQQLSKPVAKLNKETGEIIEIYPSVIEANRKNPNCNKHIGTVCLGKRKTAGGYGWKYI